MPTEIELRCETIEECYEFTLSFAARGLAADEGSVAGGQVHGRWPGIDASSLYEGRDLAVTTDFRAVLAGVCAYNLGLPDNRLASVFPGFDGTPLNLAV